MVELRHQEFLNLGQKWALSLVRVALEEQELVLGSKGELALRWEGE
jgi:hypothetical protein